jgi:molybdopterin synthase catalytic subunit
MASFVISSSILNIADVESALTDDTCGGVVIFVGNVRDKSHDRNVVALEFEAYEPMALKELEAIAREIMEKWNVAHIALHHRVGRVEVGGTAVIAGVSAKHRTEAFESCAYLMSRLKESVPIWKKEIFQDGEEWVSPHP